MPELPEVETVRRGLARCMTGRRIVRAELRRPDLRWPFPPMLASRLTGARIGEFMRRGKYILIELDETGLLLLHLGMSGRITAGTADTPSERHDHVVLPLDDGTVVRFNDPRRFGTLDYIERGAETAHPLLSGLGNIYVCEALYRAGISPRRLAGTIAGARARKLAAAIKSVLTEAIEAGGSSLRDYVQTDGELGYFQHRWAVYGREGEPCPGCTCAEGVRRIAQSGRSTFFCAKRQR